MNPATARELHEKLDVVLAAENVNEAADFIKTFEQEYWLVRTIGLLDKCRKFPTVDTFPIGDGFILKAAALRPIFRPGAAAARGGVVVYENSAGERLQKKLGVRVRPIGKGAHLFLEVTNTDVDGPAMNTEYLVQVVPHKAGFRFLCPMPPRAHEVAELVLQDSYDVPECMECNKSDIAEKSYKDALNEEKGYRMRFIPSDAISGKGRSR